MMSQNRSRDVLYFDSFLSYKKHCENERVVLKLENRLEII